MPAPTLGARTAGRANNFDALRFALAALVILSHAYPLLEGDDHSEPLFRATGGQLTFGEAAVSGFFILSGFLIAQSWETSRSAADYFRKRAARIYPGFLLTVLFCALVAGPRLASSPADYWAAFSPPRTAGAALNLDLRLPKLFGHLPVADVNGSLWSVRFEFLCYLLLALLGVTGALRRPGVLAAAVGLFLAVQAALLYADLKLPGSGLSAVWGYPPFWPRVGACFLAGALFYRCRDRVPLSAGLFLASVAGLVLLAVASSLRGLVLAVPLLGGYALLYLAFARTPWLYGFARPGDFSYGLYLYAFPVQQLLAHRSGLALSPVGLFALALPATLALAVVSWYAVERPFLRRSGHGLPRPAGEERAA
jgi:peptidoglycan/LPS O-acetylase OafA/YrhL